MKAMTHRTANHSTITLTLEAVLDQFMGRWLLHLRHQSGMSLGDLSRATGLPEEELRDHEVGTLPVPATRLPILLTGLAASTPRM